jgi:hypothetical protein
VRGTLEEGEIGAAEEFGVGRGRGQDRACLVDSCCYIQYLPV